MNEYSHGGHASVFRLGSHEQVWIPRANLVRVENTDFPLAFKQRFYAHRIASILFPDYFIDVHGARREEVHWPLFRMKFNNSLYSTEAAVPKEHAIFAKHTTFNAESEELDWTVHIEKVSTCKCTNCKNHRQFHKDQKLQEQARYMFRCFADKGIIPDNDLTDYCITEKGNILFFEVDFINANLLRPFLESIKNPNQRQKHALRILNRYQKLCQLPNTVHEVIKQVA